MCITFTAIFSVCHKAFYTLSFFWVVQYALQQIVSRFVPHCLLLIAISHGASSLTLFNLVDPFICSISINNLQMCFFDLGVNIALRKMGALVSSTSEITEEGGKIRINTQSTFKSANVLFPLGEEMEEHTMDGRKCKVCLTLSVLVWP